MSTDNRDIQVVSRRFRSLQDLFSLDKPISLIAGPCAVESMKQLETVAAFLVKCQIPFIRGGAYKPRTSPYDFQGLGMDGLKMLDEVRKKYNLLAVSELLDPRHVERGLDYIDVIQIGSRNMHNYALLQEVGKTRHPVMLKRGWMSTISELLMAAEYIVAGGNENIIVCERGIRTHEDRTRNTLDIACVAIIKQETSLPVVVDLSHSLGRTDIMLPVAKAVLAMEVDGIMVEVHPRPEQSLSDSDQQLTLEECRQLAELVRQHR